jgi:hypothetical protein
VGGGWGGGSRIAVVQSLTDRYPDVHELPTLGPMSALPSNILIGSIATERGPFHTHTHTHTHSLTHSLTHSHSHTHQGTYRRSMPNPLDIIVRCMLSSSSSHLEERQRTLCAPSSPRQ